MDDQNQSPESERSVPESLGQSEITRRNLVQTTLASAAGAIFPTALDLNGARTMAQPSASATAGTFEAFAEKAEILSHDPYRKDSDDLPIDLAKLDYDAYQRIEFRPDKTISLGKYFSLQLFHRGFLHGNRISIALQPPAGPVRQLDYDSSLFDLGPALKNKTFSPKLGYAGFRLNTAFDRTKPQNQEEFLVFLGASYFRLRGRNQVYGLSARGIAIDTAGPGTEEFPDFTSFHILEPAGDDTTITVLALLDGPSLAGAYRFVISPGETSTIDVSASLYPRREISGLGLAPLTSMFLYGRNGPGARKAASFDDFRPQVHDSDGLLVETSDDRLWRPLVNGRDTPSVSSFSAKPLRGFGLLQRERRFSEYLDVQARHEDRPGIWVTPAADMPAFENGTVQLFEIPSREEYMDNIVAAFVPSAKLKPGQGLAVAYGLRTIGADSESVSPNSLARVIDTRVGSAERLRPTNPPRPERRLYIVDFLGDTLPREPHSHVEVSLSASAGRFVDPFTEWVPQTGGWRLYAEFQPPDPFPSADVILRARLSHRGKVVTETWDAVA